MGSAASSLQPSSRHGGSLHDGCAGIYCFFRKYRLSPGSLHEFCSLALLLELQRSSAQPGSGSILFPTRQSLTASVLPPRGQRLLIHGKDSLPGMLAQAQATSASPGCCTGFVCHGLFVPFFFGKGRNMQRGAGLESLAAER